MAVDIETTKAIRGVSNLQRLVRAIEQAGEHDESDWLEWKSKLDLRSKEAWFHIARTVLGMANRLPVSAALNCEGLGYLVVGVQPGSLVGVQTVDHAELERGVSAYVGTSNGPAWSPTWIGVDDRSVLVVIVEAPKNGDPIWSLRKEWIGELAGRVFVRKMGRTAPADPEDLDRLQARLLDRAVDLPLVSVEAVTHGPLRWMDLDSAPNVTSEWVTRRRSALVSLARQKDRVMRGEPDPTTLSPFSRAGLVGEEYLRQQKRIAEVLRAAGSGFAAAGIFGVQEEDRTLEQYIDEVDTWAERLKERALEDLPRRFLVGRRNRVSVRVVNGTQRFLTDVQVKLDFEWELAKGYGHLPREVGLPTEPRHFGTARPSPLSEPWANAYLHPVTPNFNFAQPALRRSWIEDGSIHFTFDVGDLRPTETDASEPFQILLPRLPDGASLKGRWSVTMRDVDGIVSGVVELQVEPDPVSVLDLLTREDADD